MSDHFKEGPSAKGSAVQGSDAVRTGPEPPEVLDLRCSAGMCKNRGAYVVEGLCGNCGWAGEVIVSKSHENPRRARCPRCECSRVDGVGFVRTFEEQSS